LYQPYACKGTSTAITLKAPPRIKYFDRSKNDENLALLAFFFESLSFVALLFFLPTLGASVGTDLDNFGVGNLKEGILTVIAKILLNARKALEGRLKTLVTTLAINLPIFLIMKMVKSTTFTEILAYILQTLSNTRPTDTQKSRKLSKGLYAIVLIVVFFILEAVL
jgi:hypothetical protein